VSATRRLEVNGQAVSSPATTVAELIDLLERRTTGTAVAVNGAVVPRRAWASHRLADGDRVEIVGAAQGG